jgi:hypothetical protein
MHFCVCPPVIGEPNDNKLSGIPKSLSFFLHEVMSNAKLCCDSPNRHPSVFSDERINSLHSVLAVLVRPLPGRSTMSLLPSLKCFTERRTLLAPVQESA